ncbi:Cgr1 domain-containing protein [Ceratobasidium sp. AG-Ba]|nr:Cgr1 domain-containing protein [Ceratobasidium sp. AG-Ba]QRV90824.1 Cgr1 domain-containing protein [Ceratobasidium sp. AG-Ba]QRW04927.1 Cgr1 domain-containing protein [Ceratobasidium sp. AG-Ba]
MSAVGPSAETSSTQPAIQTVSSSHGRVSGKGWKSQKVAKRRSYLQSNLKSKSWEERMRNKEQENAIKKLHKEMVEEKAAEAARRRAVSQERKKARAEKIRLEELAAKMSAKKAERLRRKAGRSKKVNG